MRIPALILLFALSLGCKHQDTRSFAYVNGECERLYKTYVDSEQNEARQSLKQAVTLIEEANVQPHIKARGLWWSYSRLFVLEKRAGNNDTAQELLVKAHYWCLELAEITGASPTEALAYATRSRLRMRL